MSYLDKIVKSLSVTQECHLANQDSQTRLKFKYPLNNC